MIFTEGSAQGNPGATGSGVVIIIHQLNLAKLSLLLAQTMKVKKKLLN